MHHQAAEYAPTLVSEDEIKDLRRPERKLEQVLGRLWRVVGEDALECLHCLHVSLPNEAHMLSALHLAGGGVHVTVNLDRGIEQAYALLAGRSALPEEFQDAYGTALARWRERAGPLSPLRTVASRRQFDDWIAAGRPPALLKVHGSLPAEGSELVDVVVEDTEELGGLSLGRRAAVDWLGSAARVLITGYGGLDPDVYAPLLEAVSSTDAEWASKWLAEDSPVRSDCRRRDIRATVGDPQGLATTALRELLGEHDLQWPELELDGKRWHERFDAWAEWLVGRHDGHRFAHAWAWLLADAGDRDRAARLLRHMHQHDPNAGISLRLADVLYDRAHGRDRRDAVHLYGRLVLTRDLDWSARAHCLLRLGGIARGAGSRAGGGWKAAPPLAVALMIPCVVLAEQRRRHSGAADRETTAAALGVLGQTMLRASEQAAVGWPRWLWPVLPRALAWAAALCERCAQLSSNGNRRALANSHRLLALALSALLRGTAPDSGWAQELESLADSYRNAGDSAGAGNCTAALAVIEMAAGRRGPACQRLEEARDLYVEGRSDDRPIASGAALLTRLTALFHRVP
jgi:hypothetical protein